MSKKRAAILSDMRLLPLVGDRVAGFDPDPYNPSVDITDILFDSGARVSVHLDKPYPGENEMYEENTLREATIKLAHEVPELRPHLLPLLKEAGVGLTS